MNNDSPVLLGGARTPVGRYQGSLQSRTAVELGGAAVAATIERHPGVEPEYAILGNVLQGGSGQNPARQAIVAGGIARTVPAVTVNDVCLASITSIAWGAALVSSGRHDVVLVGGFESMSNAPHLASVRSACRPGDRLLVDMMVRDGLHCSLDDIGMGELSDAENARLGIGRDEQDALALESHRRAARAGAEVLLEHIVAVDGLDRDEGVRENTDLEQLGQLPPAFTADGTITAGNASQLSDAGGAGIICTAEVAARTGVEPLASVVDWEVVAGPDTSLHLKPAAAARTLLARNGVTPGEVDLWEINEAFAGVVLASERDLGIDHRVVNVNGGAIAVGHPLGASGIRLVLDLAYEMRHRSARIAVASICGGGGQASAVLLRR